MSDRALTQWERDLVIEVNDLKFQRRQLLESLKRKNYICGEVLDWVVNYEIYKPYHGWPSRLKEVDVIRAEIQTRMEEALKSDPIGPADERGEG